MPDQLDSHIVPFDAMRFLDGEMTASESAVLQEHLQQCAWCRETFRQVESTLKGLPQAMAGSVPGATDDATARMLLQERLAQVADERPRRFFPGVEGLRNRALLRYAAVALLTVAAMGVVLQWQNARPHVVLASALPDPKLTPGAVRAVNLDEICRTDDDDDLDPVVALPTQKTIFREYGIPTDLAKAGFQMDYLINPQLGGVDDVRNLWPQPYSSEWNAKAKDALERRLHQMVCERKIGLADAQRDIAGNWIDAYKKYFHTSKPI